MSSEDVGAHGSGAATVDYVELYKTLCTKYACRVNSALLKELRKAPHRPLTELQLANNYVGPKGFDAVMELIQTCQTIETVNLRGNGLENSNVLRLCEVLKKHMGIKKVDVGQNDLSLDAGKAIMELLRVNNRVIEVDVSGTDIYDSLSERIAQAAAANYKSQTGKDPVLKPTAHKVSKQKPILTSEFTAAGKPSVTPITTAGSKPGSAKAVDASAPKPRPPPPAVASDASSRMTDAQRDELRAAYKRRAQGFQEKASATSGASGDAAGARDELTALRIAEVKAEAVSQSKADAAAAAQPKKKPVPLVPKPPASQPPTLPKDDVEESPTRASTEARETSGAAEGTSAPSESAPAAPVEVPAPSAATAVPIAAGDGSDSPAIEPLHGGDMVMGAEEQFRTLFNLGCRHYNEKDLDAAFLTWTEAMTVASESKNREWMAIMTQNLQRLSYELLCQEGDRYVEEGRLDDALNTLAMAAEVASKARNTQWESDTARRKKSVQHMQFQAAHDAATKLFEKAVAYEETDVTDDDAYRLPDGRVIRYTKAFVNEWSRMLLIKEAVERWIVAYELAKAVSGSSGKMLTDIVHASLNGVCALQLQKLFTPDNSHRQQATFLATAALTSTEKRKLIELWSDLHAVVNTAGSNFTLRWSVITCAVIGQLLQGVFELSKASEHLNTMLEGSIELHDVPLEAAANTFLGNLNLHRSQFTDSERFLTRALDMWAQLREKGDDYTAGAATTTPWVTSEFVAYMHATTYYLLQQVMVGQYRYNDALEMAERHKVHSYRDTLYDKMLKNFVANPTVDHVAAVARSLSTPLVHYSVVYRYDWNVNKDEEVVEEQLYVWVIPYEGDVKFTLVEVTRFHNVPSILDVITEARKALHIDDGSAPSGSEMILEAPEYRWRSPLALVYTILMAPIVDFLAAHTGYSDKGTVVIIPDSILWLVPFNLLIDEKDAFFVERFVVSLAFSSTQLAFSTLSAIRARDRPAPSATHPSRRLVLPAPPSTDLPDSPCAVDAEVNGKEVKQMATCLGGEAPMDGSDFQTVVDAIASASVVHATAPVVAGTAAGSNGSLALQVGFDNVSLWNSKDIATTDLLCEAFILTNASIRSPQVLNHTSPALDVVRALTSAGASCIVMTLWRSEEMLPASFCTKMYEQAKQKKGNKALATALTMREEIRASRFQPRLWGSYAVLGVPSL